MGALMAENINHLYAVSIIDQIIKFGAKNFYVSPGLRNAPLISALTTFNDINIFTEIDERTASYRALGASKVTSRPSVLLCTSGTALLNYLPAIAEANKTDTPLIIISADRPPEMIQMNTNQTLNQRDIFLNLETPTISFETPNNETPLFETLRNLSFHLLKNISIKNRSIHLNIPFRGNLDQSFSEISPQINQSYLSILQYSNNLYSSSNEIIKDHLNRPLILIGDGLKKDEKNILKNFLKKTPIPHICDITSGLKFQLCSKDLSLPSIDHVETENFIKNYKPSCVIQFGDRFISKKYDTFLSDTFTPWYHHSPSEKNIPSKCPTIKLLATFPEVIEQIEKGFNEDEIDVSFIQLVNKRKREIIKDSNDINLPYFSKIFLDNALVDDHIFIGNSSVVRSFDYYINESVKDKTVNIYTNRGVSGIEGNIATSIGIYESLRPKSFNLILGDISFLHDLNSLKELSNKEYRIKIFVLNDQKGGIFDLLPLKLNERAKQIISSPHEFNFGEISKQFNINYKFIDSKDDLYQSILGEVNSPTIYEIRVNPDENFKVYQKLKTLK